VNSTLGLTYPKLANSWLLKDCLKVASLGLLVVKVSVSLKKVLPAQ
jgi:hypothetical protein